MIEISIPDCCSSFRKVELQKHMLKALNQGEGKLLDVLRTQWVHRYGLNTLPNLEVLSLEKSRDSSSEDFHSLTQVVSPDMEKHIEESKISLDSELVVLGDPSGSLDPGKKQFLNDKNTIYQGNIDLSDDQKIQNPLEESSVPPPPRTFHRLRRWLAVPEDEIPKAS